MEILPLSSGKRRKEILFQLVTLYNNLDRFGIPGADLKGLKVGSINSIFYFLHKAAEPFNCLEQDNLA